MFTLLENFSLRVFDGGLYIISFWISIPVLCWIIIKFRENVIPPFFIFSYKNIVQVFKCKARLTERPEFLEKGTSTGSATDECKILCGMNAAEEVVLIVFVGRNS